MKQLRVAVMVLGITAILTAAGKDPILGTWCVGEDGLVLTFSGNDSLSVTSRADASVSGTGMYKRNDTNFTATVINDDMEMKMQDRYKWLGKDTISAQALLFTVNGDSVDYPKEWMSMVRCKGPETGTKSK
jgi:hypothetical protein